jgi:putative transposase
MKETLDEAVSNTGADHIKVKHKPKLLSDTGPCYLSGEFKIYLDTNKLYASPLPQPVNTPHA